MIRSIIYKIVIIVLLSFPFSGWAYGTDAVDEHNGEETAESHHSQKKKFDPGNFIFEHIGDAYEWHVLTYKDFHLSIPLLVIAYSEDKGLNIFSSAKFHHGHETHKGFKIAQEGDYKGKLVEIMPDGSTQRPLDLSMTKNVAAIFFVLVLMLILFTSVAKKYKRDPLKAPSGFQNLTETIIYFIRDEVAIPSIGQQKHERFMPYLLTLFFFILFSNLLGLIPIPPGGANVTGNIGITGALAFLTFIMTQISGNKFYWQETFNSPNVPWWLKFPIPLLPLIELLGLLTKPFTLMIRLFANIAAGHIVILGFVSLIFVFGNINVIAGYGISVLSVGFAIFLTFLEILVALIQAYIFTMLSALYLGMAVEEEHH